MRGLLNTIGWICTLGCAAITLLANYYYGLHVTGGPERWAFAIGGAFLDGLKTVLPIALGTVLLGRITVGAFARLSLGTVFWLGLVAWSLFCAMQLYEMSRVERVGTVEADKASYQQHKASKVAAELAIEKLSSTRSTEMIEGELGAARHDRLWSRSKECADATAPESREFCKNVARLTAETATAMSAAEIKAALTAQQEKLTKAERGLEGTNLAEVLSVTDPGTQGLANALGIAIDTMRYRLALGFAALLEFGGGLGGWLMTGGHLPTWRRQTKSELEPEIEEPALCAPVRKAEIELTATPMLEPKTSVAIWAKEFAVGRKGTFTPSAEVREAFNSWAAVNGHDQLNATAFGKEMTSLGFERDKRGGVQIYVEVALAQKPKVQGLRLAVSNAPVS